MLIDIIDSYWLQVQSQMGIIAPGQQFGGVIQGRDWPGTPPLPDTLYLLFMGAVSLGGTEAQNYYEILCQWSWIDIGTDIQANQQKANRGDRWRTSMAIQSNLRQANYPSFCQKKTWNVNAQTGELIGTAINGVLVGGVESIYWSKLTFMPKQDNPKSGFIYGAASLRIYAWDDVLQAIA